MELINTVSPPHFKKTHFYESRFFGTGVCGWEMGNLCVMGYLMAVTHWENLVMWDTNWFSINEQ